VVAIKDKSLMIEIAENVHMELQKNAVGQSVIDDDDE
jgi:preprotein translocase subunit YajC